MSKTSVEILDNIAKRIMVKMRVIIAVITPSLIKNQRKIPSLVL